MIDRIITIFSSRYTGWLFFWLNAGSCVVDVISSKALFAALNGALAALLYAQLRRP